MRAFLLYISSLAILLGLVVIKALFNPFRFEWKLFPSNWKLLITPGNITAVICAILIIIGGVFLVFLHREKYSAADMLPQKLSCVQIENNEYISLFMTFLSLFIFNFDSYRDLMLFLILIGLLGRLFVKTNMYYANPCFALMGYSLYRVKLQDERVLKDSIIVLSRRKISDTSLITLKCISGNVYYCKKVTNSKSTIE